MFRLSHRRVRIRLLRRANKQRGDSEGGGVACGTGAVDECGGVCADFVFNVGEGWDGGDGKSGEVVGGEGVLPDALGGVMVVEEGLEGCTVFPAVG